MNFILLAAFLTSLLSTTALCGDHAVVVCLNNTAISNTDMVILKTSVSLPTDVYNTYNALRIEKRTNTRKTYEGPRTNLLDIVRHVGSLYNVSIKSDQRYSRVFPAPSALAEIVITNATIDEALQILVDTCWQVGFPRIESNDVVLGSSPIILRAQDTYYLKIAFLGDSDGEGVLSTRLNSFDLFHVAPSGANGKSARPVLQPRKPTQ